jgi:hypothetical protein
MYQDTIYGINTSFLIFISLLITFNVIMFYFINITNFENFPYGSYQRSKTYGRVIPRSRDRDEPEINNSELSNKSDETNDINEIQKIDTDLDTGNYKWNGNINFPYGSFTYERTYPVYPAPNICDEKNPYYSTLEGKCIDINQENTPSHLIESK